MKALTNQYSDIQQSIDRLLTEIGEQNQREQAEAGIANPLEQIANPLEREKQREACPIIKNIKRMFNHQNH